MNPEKLKQLQAQVRIGGKGTPRRKKKVVHRTATTDDKKLQSSLKKMPVNTIPGIEEVNMIKDDGTVIHFNNPKVQASLAANTFAIGGHADNKQVADLLPGIFNQLGPESMSHLKKLASNVGGLSGGGVTGSNSGAVASQQDGVKNKNVHGGRSDGESNEDDDSDKEEGDGDIPELVGNFDDPSKGESAVTKNSQQQEATIPNNDNGSSKIE